MFIDVTLVDTGKRQLVNTDKIIRISADGDTKTVLHLQDEIELIVDANIHDVALVLERRTILTAADSERQRKEVAEYNERQRHLEPE